MPPRDLRDRVAARQERIGPVEEIVRLPAIRPPPREHEGFWRTLASERDPRVDAPDECRRDRARRGTVARPLRVEVAAVLDAPRHRVALDEVGAEHFGEPPLRGTPP